MTKLAFQAPSSASSNGYIDPVYTGVLADSSFTEDDCSPHWEDTFFDDEEDVIEVFDFDYPLMEDFEFKSGLARVMAVFLFWEIYLFVFQLILVIGKEFPIRQFLFYALSLALIDAFLLCPFRRNVHWEVYSQHLCITRDGIRFVKDKRKSCFGWACSDKGKMSKTVPFDKITECDIQEPAGNTFCCVKNVLYTIKVDTASSGGRNSNGIAVPELTISGLKDPYRFKKLVWEMKRSTAANSAVHQINVPSSQNTQSNDVPQLLTEIRNVLLEQTKMLQKNDLKEMEMV